MKTYRPDFLTADDYPWVERLLELYKSCEGLSISQLEERGKHVSLPQGRRRKYQRLRQYLDKNLSLKSSTKMARSVRMNVFSEVFALPTFPSEQRLIEILDAYKAALNLGSSSDVGNLLISDLQDHRTITSMEKELTASDVVSEANLWFAKSLLTSALVANIQIVGQARRIIQLAKLRGLLCATKSPCKPSPNKEICSLEISGPAAILFKTRMYGNGFSSLLGLLPWCDSFNLEAVCQKNDERFLLQLSSQDPIKPATKPKLFDSRLEKQFSRSFVRRFEDWRLTREPGPIETKAGIIYPDFYIHKSAEPHKNFYCEIVGWWTKEYLDRKVAAWGLVKQHTFILCVDQNLGDFDSKNVSLNNVYFFKDKIDVERVMAVSLALLHK